MEQIIRFWLNAFDWLIKMSNPLNTYAFFCDDMPGYIILGFLKIFLIAPFLFAVFVVPIYWIIKIIIWWFLVLFNDLE